MEEKIIKQIKTSCPFPLLQYKVTVKYNEVRKASGIAYILLDLIQKSTAKEEKIADELLRFGIPADLHAIFGRELERLAATDIIACNVNMRYLSDLRYFSEIKLSDLKLTERGEKLFKEGAIPTGQEKVSVKDVFYSPVTRKFDLRSALPYSPLASCFLGENFLDKIEIDVSGMEDYVRANQQQFGLKAEERVIKVGYEDPLKLNTRKEEGTTISLSVSGVRFSFETTDEQAFFEKYYNSDLMTECMRLKNRYKFIGKDGNVLEVPEIESSELLQCVAVYIPDDLKRQAARPCKLYLGRGRVDFVRSDKVLQPNTEIMDAFLQKIHPNAEFALLDNSACHYYCAWNVHFPCAQFGDSFNLPLLVEYTAEQNVFFDILDRLFNYYLGQPFGEDVSRAVLYIVSATGKNDYFEKCIDRYISAIETTDGKIDELLREHRLFTSNASWKQYFKLVAINLFDESAAQIRLNNMIYKNAILSPLKSALKMTDAEYVAKFANAVRGEDENLIWQALEVAGFSVEDMLSVVNVVPHYIDAILNNEDIQAETAFATPFKTVRFNLWKLNNMLGIENAENYTVGEQYSVDEFFNVYGTLVFAYQTILKFKSYAADGFVVLERYFEIYRPIHELLSIERTSASHPEKINKEYIDGLLARGKYKDAVCDLLVKLQYDLRKLLAADNGTAANELIDAAQIQRIITREQADLLHKLRICRNNFQHPESKQVSYNKETIEKWRDAVFSVTGEE